MKMGKISAVYKIVNTVTEDSYIGSSMDVLRRWAQHKRPSSWKNEPNKQLYLDMQKYGVDKFRFQILAPVEPECLTQVEQEFIEMLQPTYNDINAKGWDVERYKESHRKYASSDKGIESQRKREQTEKRKEWYKKRDNRICLYNGEELKFCTLCKRLKSGGIEHPFKEAKKYLIRGE